MKIAIAVVLVVVLCAAAGLAALAWRASARAVHPGPASYAWSAADFPELAAEEVVVDSSTGVRLAGRFFPGSKRATVVLTHGYGGTQDEMLPVAAALHRKGYTVFTYDTRGCGGSSGEITFGAREQDDLISVVDYLASRPDVDAENLGALGFSMGGATTLLASARDPRIKAVVADSAWKTAKSWLRPSVKAVFLHPRDHLSALSLTFAELRTGVDLDDLRPVDAMRALSRRPILLIHGTADDVVLPADADALAAANANAEVWRIEGATHGATVAPGGATTSERVPEFFERALG
jgi:dipeptidyl aminopeptidase/acylaminoacyl peptidase